MSSAYYKICTCIKIIRIENVNDISSNSSLCLTNIKYVFYLSIS